MCVLRRAGAAKLALVAPAAIALTLALDLKRALLLGRGGIDPEGGASRLSSRRASSSDELAAHQLGHVRNESRQSLERLL